MSGFALTRSAKVSEIPATAANAGSLLQRQCACGKHTVGGGTCAECAKRHEGIVRREALDRRAPDIAPPIVHQALGSGGHPLDRATRAYMEPHLGRDLSHVRVHTGSEASRSAAAVNASAYTVGRDIVFGEGRYEPTSETGARLIAHEVAHTVQQAGAPSRPEHLTIGDPGDPAEREADRAAEVLAAVPQSDSRQTLRRQPAPGAGADPPLSDSLAENASPLLAAAIGSVTLDKFETGKADLTPAHQAELAKTAHNIVVLLRKYGRSTVTVSGFADTVGTEANNLTLGTSRAIAVKQALVDLKVPETIISTESKGEGGPQAVKTKDEAANPSNRRVEVRFRPEAAPTIGPLVPGLAPNAPTKAPPPAKPAIDLRYKPKIEPPDPSRPTLPPDFWKPLPPPIPGTGPKSLSEIIFEKVDPVIDVVVKVLPESLRGKAKDAIHDGIISGSAKAARAAAEAAGVTDEGALDAIENAAEAAIQEKGDKGK